ncbi:hypothetical protein [Nocardia farcinica]
MSAVWKAQVGAWRLGTRVVHLADPLPTTRDLVAMVLSDYSWRVIVGLCRDQADAAWLIPQILDGTALPAPLLDEIADTLVANLFGQPRWVVQRLWREAIGVWREVDAELGQRGVDVLALAPDRATNVIYGVLHRRRAGKQEHLQRWISELEAAPARVLDTATGMADAAAEWFAAAGMLAGGMPPIPTPPPGAAGVDSELNFT